MTFGQEGLSVIDRWNRVRSIIYSWRHVYMVCLIFPIILSLAAILKLILQIVPQCVNTSRLSECYTLGGILIYCWTVMFYYWRDQAVFQSFQKWKHDISYLNSWYHTFKMNSWYHQFECMISPIWIVDITYSNMWYHQFILKGSHHVFKYNTGHSTGFC